MHPTETLCGVLVKVQHRLSELGIEKGMVGKIVEVAPPTWIGVEVNDKIVYFRDTELEVGE